MARCVLLPQQDSLSIPAVVPMENTSELYDKGQAVRTAVLGEEHVRTTLDARMSAYTRPLQIFTIEYAWGKVWSRPELDRRSRSLLSMFCKLKISVHLHPSQMKKSIV
jgi:hypothetical protein